MKFYSAHLKPGAEPVLLREGFSWGALVFGPFWLASHRAWIPAVISLAVLILIGMLVPEPASTIISLGISTLLGLTGHDLCRWSLERRDYVLLHMVAGRGQDEALSRLLDARPDLLKRYRPEAA